MQVSIRLAAAAVFILTAGAAFAQDDAIVLLDATRKTTFCIVTDNSTITRMVTAGQTCSDLTPGEQWGFLVQGRRSQLSVIKRKFLTQYAFFVTNVTPVVNFPIEDLNEAANLTSVTPLAASYQANTKGAAPKGLSTNGTLTLRTAQDLIAELLNPATSSNPPNEIASDWLTVKREIESVRNDATAFKATWDIVNGFASGGNACLPAYGAPTLTSAMECLNELNAAETAGAFAGPGPYQDEDAFRRLVVRDNDAITMMTSLGGMLTQQSPTLATQLSAFDGDLASLRADMNTLAGNVQAARDAVLFVGTIAASADMTRAQIKSRLTQLLNSGTNPVLDPAELNVLADKYFEFVGSDAARAAVERANWAIDLVWAEGQTEGDQEFARIAIIDPTLALTAPWDTACTPEPAGVNPDDRRGDRLGCLAAQIAVRYSSLLAEDHDHLYGDLPSSVAWINTAQSRLLARANQIYDNSQVAIPYDTAINLGGQSGNLRVYFTIYETETFPRFAIPAPSSTAGPVLAATPATIAAPPGAPTSTTTAVTATGTTTTTTTPPAQPSGNPVTTGMLEVHDRYRATIVAAFAFSNIHELSVVSNPVTTGNATGSTTTCTATAPCTQISLSSSSHHNSAIVGMSFHLWGYDTFPGVQKRPLRFAEEAFGIFGGLSVQNLNDYYVGGDFQLVHGLQLMAGWNWYRQNTLAPGLVNGNIYVTAPNVTTIQKGTNGTYFGLGLNLSIFRKAFGAVTGLGTAVASSGS